MASSHLKRIVAPKTWPIVRKTTKFITRPKPNGQPLEHTLPVVVVLREMLGLVTSAAQARRILRTQPVTVNGKRVYDTDSALSFMDVLTLGGKSYRIMINQNNNLTVVQVKAGEEVTVQKIIGKTTLAKGKLQINCASGRNFLGKDEYKVGDSVTVDMAGKITAHFDLAPGASVLLVGGSHIGKVGKVEKIEGQTITVSTADGSFTTATRHAYVVGKDKPAITMS